MGTGFMEMKLSPDFCFAIPEGGGTLPSWSKMAVSALATKPMFQAAGWSGKRKKAYPFPFRETTQKFHATHNFWLHFTGEKLGHMTTTVAGETEKYCRTMPSQKPWHSSFKKKSSGSLGSRFQAPLQNKPLAR